MESFTINQVFPVKAKKLFKAWLSSKMHGQMTGSKAEIEPVVDGKFDIWDGYITGNTIQLVQDEKIVQKWRTTEFPKGAPDSLLTLEFKAHEKGTDLILTHSEIPDGQGDQYKQGWIDYYFEPMKDYFARG